MAETTENNNDKSQYIDLRLCQSMLDEYKATLKLRRQQQQQRDAAESTQTSSSNVQLASAAAGDTVELRDDETADAGTAASAAAAAADNDDNEQRQSAAANGCVTEYQQIAVADSNGDLSSSAASLSQAPVYASVQKPKQNLRHKQNDHHYLEVNTSDADKNDVTVTSDGVAVPIKFSVRLVGSVPMSAGDRSTSASTEFVVRHLRRLCKHQQKNGDSVADLPPDVVCYWPTDVDITLELSGKCLHLIDASAGTDLFSQRLHSVKQWSTGRGTTSRHFAFVSPEPSGERFACHVFRCCGDCRADDVTSTLRRVCSEMMEKKQLAEVQTIRL